MESDILKAVEDYLRQGESLPGLALILAGSLLEYVFPPFPGDTVVLLGAFLAAWAAWTPWKVLAVTLAGALAGAWIDTLAGRLLRDYLTGRRAFASPALVRLTAFTRRPSFQAGLDRVVGKLRRHGPVIILVNRFFPGIRALFFVGAGMARIPMWKVLVLGGISAALWNAAIFLAGYMVGDNWGALHGLFRSYTKVVYVLLIALALAAAALFLVRLLKKSGKGKGPSPPP
jgi:membrane protein DedA with SNARE-associated domain